MAASSQANLPNILITNYSREAYIAPHERFMAKFYDSTQDWSGGKEPGLNLKWGIWTKDSQAAGAVADGGNFPDFNPPTVLQGTLTVKEVAAAMSLTERMLAQGASEGAIWLANVVDTHVKMTTRNFMQALNRHSLGHGTGRMAAVEAGTSSSTSFVARLPEHVLQLRRGMQIAFYDTDTGGSKQGATETIQSINFETRTVTIGNARSLTAGWGVYKATGTSTDEYGIVPMGLRGINDNGTLTASLFGITRSASPEINASVLNAGGGASSLQSYSEKLVRKGIHRLEFYAGFEPEEIWTNRGIISEHLNHLTGNRMYTIGPGENVPKYKIGANESELAFHYGGKDIPFKVDTDLPARELHIIVKSLYFKNVLKKPTWLADDSGPEGQSTPYLFQAPGGTNSYALQKVAGMHALLDFGHKQPEVGCAITQLSDEELAGDV